MSALEQLRRGTGVKPTSALDLLRQGVTEIPSLQTDIFGMQTSTPAFAPPLKRESFFAPSQEGVGTRDVLREIPSTALKTIKAIPETFIPALTNFAKTTGGIIGEGLAYAVDPNVREQSFWRREPSEHF